MSVSRATSLSQVKRCQIRGFHWLIHGHNRHKKEEIIYKQHVCSFTVSFSVYEQNKKRMKIAEHSLALTLALAFSSTR